MSKELTKAELKQKLRQQSDIIKQLKADLRAEQSKKAPVEKIVTKQPAVSRIEDVAEIARLKAIIDRMEREAKAK